MAHVPGQPEDFMSQGSPGLARGSPSLLPDWGPASERTVQVWFLSPEKKWLLVAAKRGVSGDPVIKYTSLSCGPRNPCLKANQFPAPGGMIAVSHPETQIKHHFTDTGHKCFKPRGKGGMINGKGRGHAGGRSQIKSGTGRVMVFLFSFLFLFFLFFFYLKKINKENKKAGL